MAYLNKIFSFLVFFSFCNVIDLASQNTFPGAEAIGRWNITVKTGEGNFPAWLEVKRSGVKNLVGYYVGSEGSARPISKIHYNEGSQTYSFTIPPQWVHLENDLHVEFRLENDRLSGNNKVGGQSVEWTGVRAPELSRAAAPKWGKPVNYLDSDLSKWVIPDNSQFHVQNGVLINKESGGNLVTKEKFDDFKVQLEFRYPEGSNSGIYLRGRYEVQIADYYGQKPHEESIGGVYGFIAPTINAAKKANEWQTMEIVLVGRLVTVTLNGVEVICNRPIPGITGGALDANEGEPGPLMIQGDHGPVEFRKISIIPAVN